MSLIVGVVKHNIIGLYVPTAGTQVSSLRKGDILEIHIKASDHYPVSI